jgi:hypothetical protein
MKIWLAVAFGSALALLASCLPQRSPMQISTQLTPDQVCSSQPPEGDYDGDGILNVEECKGFVQGNNGATLTWPGWLQPSTAGKPRLNPTQRDLFIVLLRTNPSYIPGTPFEFISKAPPDGLGINVYEIPAADVQAVLGADRNVVDRGTTFQKAIKISESLSASAALGKCDEAWATPNGLDNCFVFTKAIKDHIDATCAGIADIKCMDNLTGKTPQTGLYDVYIKHTIAHECGHDVKLRGTYVSSTGGYHYASSDNVILSQSVDFRRSGKTVTWFIGTRYTWPNDQQDFVLRESLP